MEKYFICNNQGRLEPVNGNTRTYVDSNGYIYANKIIIGKNTSWGKNIKIECKGTFEIGDYSRIGDNCEIFANNVKIGKHLFNSSGLRVGGGGRQYPNANLTIGDRCTIHNNFINVCEPVLIGNDVGLSPDVTLVTHGYWLSALEGFPYKFAGITISDGVIVGYRSTILMGVNIAKNIVIGAESVVCKNLTTEKAIYAGNPCKILKQIEPYTRSQQIEILKKIISDYKPIADYHNVMDYTIYLNYPYLCFNHLIFNVIDFSYSGVEDEDSDDFRDYIRKYGIRIYTERPFVSKFKIN